MSSRFLLPFAVAVTLALMPTRGRAEEVSENPAPPAPVFVAEDSQDSPAPSTPNIDDLNFRKPEAGPSAPATPQAPVPSSASVPAQPVDSNREIAPPKRYSEQVPPQYYSEEVQYFPAPPAFSTGPRKREGAWSQASRLPRRGDHSGWRSGVQPAEWDEPRQVDVAEELYSPWTPLAPNRRPTVKGRWVWIPEPSEIRGNGFFDPDALQEPCEIGPCEAARRTERQDQDDVQLRQECPLCRERHQDSYREEQDPFGAAEGEMGSEEPPCEFAELADIMARLPRATEGSLFDEGVDCPGHGKPASVPDRRRAALESLRRIEAEADHVAGFDFNPSREQRPATAPTEQRVADSIRAMRETSFDLDIAAQRLEEQHLYYRADQLREFANQLRQEARSSLGGWSLKRLYPQTREAPVGAQRDLGLELEQLRDELQRVREALRQPGKQTSNH